MFFDKPNIEDSEKAQGKLPCLVYLDLSSNDQLTTDCLSSICAMTSSPGEIFSKIFSDARRS